LTQVEIRQDTLRKDLNAWQMKEEWAEHRKKWKRLQDMPPHKKKVGKGANKD